MGVPRMDGLIGSLGRGGDDEAGERRMKGSEGE
jgi:hypothetical protein